MDRARCIAAICFAIAETLRAMPNQPLRMQLIEFAETAEAECYSLIAEFKR